MEFINKIIRGDCLEVMKQMPDESIDLAVTSPPYNLKNSTGNGMKAGTKTGKWKNNPLQNGYAHHNDEMPHDKYVEWQRACLSEMMRLLKDTGAIFYNHKWRVQNGLIQDHADIIEGFPVRQIIIWRRKGGFNFNPGYFVPTYEVVYLIAKKKFKLAPKATATATFGNLHRNLRTATPRLFRLPYLIAALNPRPAEIILDPFSGSGTTSVAPLFTKSSTD